MLLVSNPKPYTGVINLVTLSYITLPLHEFVGVCHSSTDGIVIVFFCALLLKYENDHSTYALQHEYKPFNSLTRSLDVHLILLLLMESFSCLGFPATHATVVRINFIGY